MADGISACASLSLNSACTSVLEDDICADETVIPWNRLFICTSSALENDPVKFWGFIVALCFITLVVMWIGVNLLSKVSVIADLHSLR